MMLRTMTLKSFMHAGIPSVTVGSISALKLLCPWVLHVCAKSLFGLIFFSRWSWFVSTGVILCSVSVGALEKSARAIDFGARDRWSARKGIVITIFEGGAGGAIQQGTSGGRGRWGGGPGEGGDFLLLGGGGGVPAALHHVCMCRYIHLDLSTYLSMYVHLYKQ